MTVREWIESRDPAPPAELAARIAASLGDAGDRDSGDASRACLDAAFALLGSLIGPRSLGRESAIDLLVADALVTYAFEAAASHGGALDSEAADAMRRLAALAGHGERFVA